MSNTLGKKAILDIAANDRSVLPMICVRPTSMECRMLRRPEVLRIVPLSDTTIYRLEQREEFPRRFHLTPRSVVWTWQPSLAIQAAG